MRAGLGPTLALGALLAWISGGAASAEPAPTSQFVPPVDAPIVRHYEEPGTQWGPGHRGVDFEVEPGTAVRAAGAGRVTFAGAVAGRLVVTIDHGNSVQSSYSELSEVLVNEGETVLAGRWVGRVGAAHGGRSSGLHFSVRVEGAYVDPASLLGSVDAGAAIRLAPVLGWSFAGAPDWLRASEEEVAAYEPACAPLIELPVRPSAPNDNIAIAVAGMGSRTAGDTSASIYEHGPELLGYSQVYEFSYSGTDGPDLHEPYLPASTLIDIRESARKLDQLVRAVARRHPGRDIDLIAHSQGGIVARLWLETRAAAMDRELPRVEHLITFSSPHTGAPGAELIGELGESAAGRRVLAIMSAWARAGGPLPDPAGPAVAQLAPGSLLIGWLAASDVGFGTRVLTLGALDDAIVPPHRSAIEGERHHTVGPSAGFGHSAILTSRHALALAHAFLRGAPAVCPGAWDRWGGLVGRLVEGVYRSFPWGIRAAAHFGGG